ncbi:MAG: hypothetical protein ACFCUW_00620 [Kiloniellaceae bacterium]
MNRVLATVLAASFLLVSAPTVSIAAPIDNGDGSQTCNASGPSGGTTPGVCANDMKTNEDLCDGGLSSEPGGGVTCAENRAQDGKVKKLNQRVGAEPKHRLRLK